MDAHAVAHGELDVMPVQHRHQVLFEVVVRADRHALTEDRLAIDSLHRDDRLEDVELVLRLPSSCALIRNTVMTQWVSRLRICPWM